MLAERRAKDEGRNCIRLTGETVPSPNDETDQMARGDLVEAALWAR
jgi:hypothetical protein